MRGTGKPRFFYGYIVVVAAAIIQLIILGTVGAFGVFFKPLLVDFGWSRAMVSGAASLSQFVNGLIAIVVGGLNDRFGPRIVMTALGVFFGLGYLLMSQINNIWQLYLFYGVIVGIGVSGADVVLLSTVARWFVKARGAMSGIVKAGTGMGILIMPLVANWLIYTRGWRTACVVLGVLSLAIVILGAQLLRRDPGKMWLQPDGEEKAVAGNPGLTERGLSFQEAARTTQFWAICAAYLIVVFCATTVLVHIAPHATDLGISATSAAGILSIIGGASIIGRLVMGRASDRIGIRLGLLICFAILLATLLWLLSANQLWMFYLFAAVYGFAHGGFFALVSPAVARLFGISSHGLLLGIVLFSGAIGGAVGSTLAGYMFDITGNYHLVFLVLAGLSLCGLMLSLLIRPIDEGGINESKRGAGLR